MRVLEELSRRDIEVAEDIGVARVREQVEVAAPGMMGEPGKWP